MQLNQFNGGLNARLAPHLININEAQKYINVDNAEVSLRPVRDNTDEQEQVDAYMYYYNGTWVSSANYRTYQEFQERLYYSNGIDVPQKTTDGVTWYDLGIKKPDNAPTTTLGPAGELDGTLQYCYTYYNIEDGTESQPSGYSIPLLVANEQVDIELVASLDSQVTNIRVYRLGGNLTTMQLVVELPNTSTSYTDDTPDLSIPGSVLDSYASGQAPEGLNYLTEHNAMFFGSVKDKLYYCDIAFVNSWSPFNFIDFSGEITGIGSVPNGLLVFTKFKTYIVTGTSPNTLSRYLLNGNQGCIEHKSIKFASNTLIWVSTDGACVSNGGEVIVLSRDKLCSLVSTGFSTLTDSAVFDDVYYIGYAEGIMAIDFRFGTIFRLIDTLVDGFHIHNDVLYYSRDGNLHSLGTSENNKTFIYKSPKLSDGQISNLKNYKSIYMNCIRELEVKIYIDGGLVITKNIEEGTTEILIPQESRRGYYIEFEISGSGELLELQYIVEGRQNGK